MRFSTVILFALIMLTMVAVAVFVPSGRQSDQNDLGLLHVEYVNEYDLPEATAEEEIDYNFDNLVVEVEEPEEDETEEIEAIGEKFELPDVSRVVRRAVSRPSADAENNFLAREYKSFLVSKNPTVKEVETYDSGVTLIIYDYVQGVVREITPF